MKEIQLTQGKVALVDDEDFERLSAYQWRAESFRGRWLALRVETVGTAHCVFFMHREVVIAPDGIFVEHRNDDGLDNRKDNLWSYRKTEKVKKPKADSRSGFYGVYEMRCLGTWRAFFKLDGRAKYVGDFDTPEEAHVAWCVASQVLGSSFARLK